MPPKVLIALLQKQNRNINLRISKSSSKHDEWRTFLFCVRLQGTHNFPLLAFKELRGYVYCLFAGHKSESVIAATHAEGVGKGISH